MAAPTAHKDAQGQNDTDKKYYSDSKCPILDARLLSHTSRVYLADSRCKTGVSKST